MPPSVSAVYTGTLPRSTTPTPTERTDNNGKQSLQTGIHAARTVPRHHPAAILERRGSAFDQLQHSCARSTGDPGGRRAFDVQRHIQRYDSAAYQPLYYGVFRQQSLPRMQARNRQQRIVCPCSGISLYKRRGRVFPRHG